VTHVVSADELPLRVARAVAQRTLHPGARPLRAGAASHLEGRPPNLPLQPRSGG